MDNDEVMIMFEERKSQVGCGNIFLNGYWHGNTCAFEEGDGFGGGYVEWGGNDCQGGSGRGLHIGRGGFGQGYRGWGVGYGFSWSTVQ
jgi:hypothetical protein